MSNEAPEELWISPKQAWLYAKPEGLRDPFDTQQYRRVDPPAAPVDERGKALEDRLWEALKTHSCKKPDDAKLIVFLSEKKFREAVGPVLATVRAEVWRDAILTVDTAPLCHCAGKQYIDPVALVQRMNDALESTRTGKVEG